MIGISQLQFPSSDSSRLKFASYFATFASLTILTNPVNAFFSFGTIFFRSEFKTFYTYKEIKAVKRQKISKKEYWEIFFKDNKIKLASFFLFSVFIAYITFTTTFLLASLFGTVPIAMLMVLLQSELRPKDFNPFTLLKAALNFFLEGIKENSRAMVNKFDNAYEHLLPHQLNEDINENINKLKGKYSKEIPNDVINNIEFKRFIDYIVNSCELRDQDKGKIILFLEEFCSNNEKHSSDLTGAQILLLALRACNDGDHESIKNKKDALIANLIDTQTFSRKERIPNTCFTGVIYRMLSTLEGIHPDPEIIFTPPVQMLLPEAESKARRFMLERLKKKKNNKEILNAWYNVQNGSEDRKSKEIVDDFISEIRIPLMRELFGWASQYSEQIVFTLMNNIGAMKLSKLHGHLWVHIKDKLIVYGLDNQESLFESIKEKVFLETLNKGLLKTDFSLKDSCRDKAKSIADKVLEEEVTEFKLKAERAVEGQTVRMLDSLRVLPKERRCYRTYAELSKNNENNKEKIKKILQERLEITEEEMNGMLKRGASRQLELNIEEIYRQSKGSVTQLYEKTEEVKKEFIQDGLLTEQEVKSIVGAKVMELNKIEQPAPSSNLSRTLSVSSLVTYPLGSNDANLRFILNT